MAPALGRVRERMLLCALILSALSGASPGAAQAAPPDGVDRVAGEIDIPCATTSVRQDVDWYFPAGAPRGTAVVVHGFGATKDQYRELATALAADGDLVFVPTLPLMDLRGCALSSVIPNKGFLDNIAGVLGHGHDSGGALERSFRAAAEQAGRPDAQLPERLVLVGHSAGGDAVFRIGEQLATVYGGAGLAGLVQLDPVRGFDTTVTDDSLAALAPSGLPIEVIATPPSLCNNGTSGTEAMRKALPGRFLGIEMTTGSHVDALGTADKVVAGAAGLFCGTVTERNAALTREFATTWVHDELTGARTADYYPGGGLFDGLVSSNVISVVTGR